MKFSNPFRSDSKGTNPKDAVGSDKIPVHLWPATATIMGAMGLLDGMLKYGRMNWRPSGVRFTIYYDALMRHTFAMNEGEWLDPDSGLPHLSHILACAAIIADAHAAGVLNDDRNYPGGYRAVVEELTPEVVRLKAKYADRHPHHYTIGDADVIERAHNIAKDHLAAAEWANLTSIDDDEVARQFAAALAAEGIALRPVVHPRKPLDTQPGDLDAVRPGVPEPQVGSGPAPEVPEPMVGGTHPALRGLDVDEAAPGTSAADLGGNEVDAPDALADGAVWPSLADVGVGEQPAVEGGNPDDVGPSPSPGAVGCYCNAAEPGHPVHLAREEMNQAGDNLELHYFVIREDGLTEDV